MERSPREESAGRCGVPTTMRLGPHRLTGDYRAVNTTAARVDRQDLLLRWEEELLKGGATLSEFSVFLIQDASLAFCAGADLAALLAAQAAMEAHLRYEFGSVAGSESFAALIDRCDLPDDLRARLHETRRYRNLWVHVADPESDQDLLAHPEQHREQLAHVATSAMRVLYEVIFLDQWV